MRNLILTFLLIPTLTWAHPVHHAKHAHHAAPHKHHNAGASSFGRGTF